MGSRKVISAMRWKRFIVTSNDMSYDFGIYATNWNWPLDEKQWEIGISFWKWTFGIELYK